KEDSQLLGKSFPTTKEDFLKPEDFSFNENDIIEMEQAFKDIESKHLGRADLYRLFETIKNCNLYKEYDYSSDYLPHIGPVSTLEYMVESTFGFDRTLKSSIIDHILSLEKHIFRWRSVLGDGNCYFRAV